MIQEARKGVNRGRIQEREKKNKSISVSKAKDRGFWLKWGQTLWYGQNWAIENVSIIKPGYLRKQNRMKKVKEIIHKKFNDKVSKLGKSVV